MAFNPFGTAISTAISVAQAAAQQAKKPTTTTSGSSSNKFSGSATNVGTFDTNQDAIKQQMNANSQAWHNATTQAEKDRLHAANQSLAAQLGGNVSYNSSTGTWSGQGGMPADSPFTPTDNREYITAAMEEYLKQRQEALKGAYDKNVSDLNAEQGKLGANYQGARNAEAADSALSQQRYNETAAAYGLNSGTAGQANLSYANQLQSDLSALHAAESAANQEIERQRTNLSKEYQSAMVQAQAENNYKLFEQLYAEVVRIDQALQNQSQYNSSLALQKYQTMLDKLNSDRNYDYTVQQNDKSDQFDAAKLAAGLGDFSLFGKLYNWDDAFTKSMEDKFAANNAPKPSSGGGGGSSGGGGSNGASGDVYQRLYDSGYKSEAQAYSALLSMGYNSTEATKMAQYFSDMMSDNQFGGNDGGGNNANYAAELQAIYDNAIRRGDSAGVTSALVNKVNQWNLDEATAAQLLQKYGINAVF